MDPTGAGSTYSCPQKAANKKIPKKCARVHTLTGMNKTLPNLIDYNAVTLLDMRRVCARAYICHFLSQHHVIRELYDLEPWPLYNIHRMNR